MVQVVERVVKDVCTGMYVQGRIEKVVNDVCTGMYVQGR